MAVIKSANSEKRSTFRGVITAASTQEDVIAKYNSILGGAASLYTSKSGSVQIVSDPHTHIFNPITTSGDMDESDADAGMSSLSSVDDQTAHLGMCTEGCSSYVLASSHDLLRFCPVFAGAVDPLDDEDADDSDLEDFDMYDSESGDDSDDDDSDSDSDSDDEGDDDSDSDDDEDEKPAKSEKKEKPKAETPPPAPPKKEEKKEEPKADPKPEVAKDEPKKDEKPKDDKECKDGEKCDDSKEKATARVVSVSSSRQGAIKNFVKALVEQESSKFVSINTGAEFFAAEGSEINYDPTYADEVKQSEHDLESISSVLDSVQGDKIEANFMVCASSECGAHIVSNFEVDFCPVCASSVEEPEVDTDSEDLSDDSDDLDSDDSDDSDLDFDVSFDEEDEDAEESDSSSSPEKTINNVLSFISGGNELVIDKLDVSYSGTIAGESSWTAFYSGQPIARATSSSASKHKGIFENPTFANAVYTGAKELGIPKILVEMGFQPTMTSVSVSDNLKQNILNRAFREKVSAMEKQFGKELTERSEEFQQRFVAALSTAAMGINRGFFKGYTNPMKASLWNALSAAGMRNPEVVIDNIFKSHSDDYHKNLLDKTLEIMAKPVDIQNELANAVAESNFVEVSASSMSDDVETRLSGFGKVVPKEEKQASTSSSSNVVPISADRMKSVIAGLGKR